MRPTPDACTDAHDPFALYEAARVARNGLRLTKTKLNKNFDPGGLMALDRTVTRLYADGTRYVVTLRCNGIGEESLLVNGVNMMGWLKGDVDDAFNELTGHYSWTFDKELANVSR